MRFEFDTVLHVLPEGGAYVAFPGDIRQIYGRGRVKVNATFDGVPYQGSIVNMGLKHPDGSVCYILGVLKAIRKQLGKGDGDVLRVTVEERP
ncbi:MAG: DUF1905 domain-containing protein [Clostridia bacterium]|nr:DUF1905 domain-containing protein [Clostridia bacterium]